VTTRADFANDEWEQLVQLPRWVVAAASAAQPDLAFRTNIEMEAGFIASANGRESDSPLVTAVAADTLKIFDNRATVQATHFADLEAGIQAVLERVRTANQLLKGKADVADAMAYRRWLLTITDIVIRAARTGDVLGFGGKLVTAPEQRFRDQMVLILQS
jgi:hypothetical protein